jgi:Tol biopolymer transport system component
MKMNLFRYFYIPSLFIILVSISSCNNSISPVTNSGPVYGENAVFSSDGRHMVYFDWKSESENGTYLLDMDGFVGSNKRKIGYLGWYSFSPDNQWVFYNIGGDSFKKRIEGDTAAIRLTTNMGIAIESWSKDCEWGAYVSGEGSPSNLPFTWKMKFDGTRRKRLTYAPTEGEISNPSWFPDGIRLGVIRSYATGEYDAPQIAIIDTNGNSVAQLTNDSEFKRNIKVSPDGNYVAYEFDRDFGTICIVKADGTGLKVLTSGHSSTPTWSADSQFVIYTNTQTSNEDPLWYASIDGLFIGPLNLK